MAATLMNTDEARAFIAAENLMDLACDTVGGRVVFATDEWFAACDNMIKQAPPQWREGEFTTFGKWMDGWECRRRREAGHDWCIFALGLPGVVQLVEVDTAYFTGNQSPQFSVQVCDADASSSDGADGGGAANARAALAALAALRVKTGDAAMGTKATAEALAAAGRCGSGAWRSLVPMTALRPGTEAGRRHFFRVDGTGTGGGGGGGGGQRVTHVRVNMHPDGGIARLRCHGRVKLAPRRLRDLARAGALVDLAAAANGGVALRASNAHYGAPANLVAPGRARNMGEGWETARNPRRPPAFSVDAKGHLVAPGKDWAVMKLGAPGRVRELEVDTNHFKGNFPESCVVEGCYAPEALAASFDDKRWVEGERGWRALLPRTRLKPHARQFFHEAGDPAAAGAAKARATMAGGEAGGTEVVTAGGLVDIGPITHLRLVIYPDGGVSRLRAWGVLDTSGRSKL